MDFVHIISLIGGVALFLYGMSAMGSGLSKVAGSKMESYLWKLSSTPLKGFLLGTFVTMVIQSSSATSVMTVSFINSGMMKLSQAVCIILGANVGTTMTGWILNLSNSGGDSIIAQIFSSSSLVSILAIAGIVMFLFIKKTSTKNVGLIFLGLSILLLSMTLISNSVEPLEESEQFKSILTMFSNPVLGILSGILVAAVVQSASAGVGILQALCVTGAIPLSACMPLILGINIGASVPVLFSMAGSSRNGKRAAMTYLVSNVLGVFVIYILYLPLSAIFDFSFMNEAGSVFSIALMNTLIKVIIAVVLLPCHKLIEKLLFIIIKPSEDEKDDLDELESLKDSLLNYTPVALEVATSATVKMAEISSKNIIRSMELLWKYDSKTFNKIQTREALADKYEDKIGNFVVRIGKHSLNEKEQSKVSQLLNAISDFERLSDHSANISEVAQEKHDKKIQFSKQSENDIRLLTAATLEILDLSVLAFKNQNIENAKKIEALEEVIDEMCKRFKSTYIERMSKSENTIETGFVFNDLIVNLERISDHCSNIAFGVLHSTNLNAEEHKYAESIVTDNDFVNYFKEYKQKYLINTI